MIIYIILGILLVGIGAIFVYLARFLLNNFLSRFANEKGILVTKLIGLIMVVLGALVIFFVGAGEYR